MARFLAREHRLLGEIIIDEEEAGEAAIDKDKGNTQCDLVDLLANWGWVGVRHYSELVAQPKNVIASQVCVLVFVLSLSS